MKKGIISFFILTLCFITPSMAQAQVVEEAKELLNVLNEYDSISTTSDDALNGQNELEEQTCSNTEADMVEEDAKMQVPDQSEAAHTEESTESMKQADTLQTEPSNKGKSLLSGNLLGVSIGLLEQKGDQSSDRSLLSVDIQDPVKLHKQSDGSEEDQTSNDSKLLGIGLDLPVVGGLNLDVLSNKSDESSLNHSLLGLGISDSELLGDLNLDVVNGQREGENDFSGGLVSANLDNPLLGGAHVGVIEGKKAVSDSETSISGGLVLADLFGTTIGDAHVGVSEISKVVTPEYTKIKTGLINADLNNPVLGQYHVGAGEYEQTVTDEGKIHTGGLVIIGTEDTPIGDNEMGIGDFEHTQGNNQPSPESANPNDVDRYEEDPNPEDESKIEEKPDSKDDSNSEGDLNPARKSNGKKEPSHHKSDSDRDYHYHDSIIPNVPEKEKVVLDNEDEHEGTKLDFIPKKEIEAKSEVVETTESEQIESISREQNIEENIAIISGKQILDAGQSTMLNQQTETDLDELQNLINEVNEKERNKIKVTAPGGPTTPYNSSSTGSSSTSSINGGTGISAYFAFEFMGDLEFNQQVFNILRKLSDQWIKAPPNNPPKQTFFFLDK